MHGIVISRVCLKRSRIVITEVDAP